jgi:adenylate kinase family enzyme
VFQDTQKVAFIKMYIRSTHCIKVAQSLNLVRRCTEANIRIVDRWLIRDTARSFKPRWSEDDEKTYRNAINYHTRRVQHQVQYLKDQQQKIKTALDSIDGHHTVVSQ